LHVIEAHDLFAARGRPDGWAAAGIGQVRITIPGRPPLVTDCWPAMLVAAVSLAGRLDSAQTLDDLDRGVQHCGYLLREQVVTAADLAREAQKVVNALVDSALALDALCGQGPAG
jgi:hypothetical protein